MSTKTYFFKNAINSYVKIGKSNNIPSRIAQVQGHCNFLKLECFYSIEGNFETQFHTYFKEFRKEGEWFDIPNLTIELIENVLNSFSKKDSVKPKIGQITDEFILVKDGRINLKQMANTEPAIETFLNNLEKVYKPKDYNYIVKAINGCKMNVSKIVINKETRYMFGNFFVPVENIEDNNVEVKFKTAVGNFTLLGTLMNTVDTTDKV